ncbi:nuclear transport factor 2 family protein [uncultured Phenylobacterium sp.]|uniref:nuclear transport factor 2 family protein n=1 Tax=uncultured Phenylobacterium sp. TaxID=349273 RepID=UPI0025E66C79|nr:nuclear transport factor 2 family protein [uncultured Phenylobacterium sp.]
MDLHPAIQTYFDADRRRDQDAVTEVFGPDATVADEGRTHEGREAIGAWWSETKAQYEALLEPLEATRTDGATVVRTRVTGNFPGSPVTLTFAFRLAGEHIKALEIGA